MLFAVCGSKGSGKTTVANYIAERVNCSVINFADVLKKICKDLFLLTDDQLNNVIDKEVIDGRWGCSPRTMMQFVGTELLRKNLGKIIPELGEDIFVKHLEYVCETLKYNAVIGDLRFVNESEFIIKNNGIIILIDNGKSISDMHVSETEYKNIKYNHIIYNISTLENLKIEIDKILDLYR